MTKKTLLLLSLLTLLSLRARAEACASEPCDAVQAPCPEGETCVANETEPPAPAAPCPEGETCAVPPAEPSPPSDCPEGSVCANADSAPAPTPDVQVTMGPVIPAAAAPLPVEPLVRHEAPAEPAPRTNLHHFGMGLSVGVIDGAGLDLYFRPAKWLRTSAGGTYNTIAAGFHGGLTLAPFGWGPSVTAEAGHALQGNINAVYGTHEPALSSVGYSYANLHGGWEFGHKRATFFIHVGESFIATQVHNLNQQLNSSQVTFTKDPNVSLWVPSFKLGLVIYFG
jgi:hypothetical protein